MIWLLLFVATVLAIYAMTAVLPEDLSGHGKEHGWPDEGDR